MPDRLTQSGLHIASALAVSVYAHNLETLVWQGPRGCAAYSHVPGPLPGIMMDAGELKHSRDPVLLNHKGESGPRWHGSYQRAWWSVEGAVIDFNEATYGAHVVWQVDMLPAPGFICGGSHDVTFDGREDIADLVSLSEWIGLADPRGDWNQDGRYDFFDLLEFVEGF